VTAPVEVATRDGVATVAGLGLPDLLERLVPGEGPWELEVGFGKGRFLLARAAALPGRRFLGLEIARDYFRLAAGRTLLEVPAGTLDRGADGSLEDPDLAARRELEEETGFRAGSWEHLGAFWTAPGFATELMHLYLARDLVPADGARLGPDDDERLELEHVPWREAVAAAEQGGIADAKTLVGVLWLARILEAAAR